MRGDDNASFTSWMLRAVLTTVTTLITRSLWIMLMDATMTFRKCTFTRTVLKYKPPVMPKSHQDKYSYHNLEEMFLSCSSRPYSVVYATEALMGFLYLLVYLSVCACLFVSYNQTKKKEKKKKRTWNLLHALAYIISKIFFVRNFRRSDREGP